MIAKKFECPRCGWTKTIYVRASEIDAVRASGIDATTIGHWYKCASCGEFFIIPEAKK